MGGHIDRAGRVVSVTLPCGCDLTEYLGKPMAKKKAAAARKKRATRKKVGTKQTYLNDELSPPTFPEIDRLQEEYRDAKAEWAAAAEKRDNVRAELMRAMRDRELTEYNVPGTDWRVVIEEHADTVAVKKKPKPTPEDVDP